MRLVPAAFVSICLLSGLSVAQELSSSSDQPNPSVAAAARANAAPKVDPAKEADIRRLLQITGASAMATQSMDDMEKNIKPLVANALPPGDYRDKLVDLFFEKFRSNRDPSALINLVIPVYDKYLSDQDVQDLIQVYQTPMGKKLLSVMPKVMAESQAAGVQWGERVGRQSMLDVLSEHPELQKAMEEAKRNTLQQ